MIDAALRARYGVSAQCRASDAMLRSAAAMRVKRKITDRYRSVMAQRYA